MNLRSVRYVMMWVVVSALPAIAVEQKPVRVHESAEDRFFREAESAFDSRMFGADEKRACDKLLSNAKSGMRLRLLAVLSRYHREMEKDPVAALDAISYDSPTTSTQLRTTGIWSSIRRRICSRI